MRLLICGDRHWTDVVLIAKWIDDLKPNVVIEGGARGADTIAANLARDRHITVSSYPADWDTYGPAAGPIRNADMLELGNPDRVLAFHDNIDSSKGTHDMVKRALEAGKRVTIISHSGIHDRHYKGLLGG